jgi:hypothetical protein
MWSDPIKPWCDQLESQLFEVEYLVDEDSVFVPADVAAIIAMQLENADVQGLIFPSVVEGGDDNLIVYLTNCAPKSVRIQNEDEFIEEARKIVAKRR